jgi:hypothetical protein
MNHKMSERPQETRLDFGSDEILAQSNAKQAAPIERSVAIGGVLLIVPKAKKTDNAAIRGAGAMRNPPQSGYTRPSSEMGNERDQKQYQKDEKQDLRDAGECNSDASEADSARDERDDQKYQSPIQHCSVSFLLLDLHPLAARYQAMVARNAKTRSSLRFSMGRRPVRR